MAVFTEGSGLERAAATTPCGASGLPRIGVEAMPLAPR